MTWGFRPWRSRKLRRRISRSHSSQLRKAARLVDPKTIARNAQRKAQLQPESYAYMMLLCDQPGYINWDYERAQKERILDYRKYKQLAYDLFAGVVDNVDYGRLKDELVEQMEKREEKQVAVEESNSLLCRLMLTSTDLVVEGKTIYEVLTCGSQFARAPFKKFVNLYCEVKKDWPSFKCPSPPKKSPLLSKAFGSSDEKKWKKARTDWLIRFTHALMLNESIRNLDRVDKFYQLKHFEPKTSSRDLLTTDVRVLDFNVCRVLANGQFSLICLASNTKRPDEFSVLKVVSRQNAKKIKMGAADYDLEKEARLLRRLTAMKCQYFVPLKDTFSTSRNFYFVMDYAIGGTLQSHIRYARFTDEDIMFYAAFITLALEYLHCRGILHMGLSTSNIVLDHAGYPKLVGFGSAVTNFSYDDKEAPHMKDWYDLGVVLYTMHQNRPPWKCPDCFNRTDCRNCDIEKRRYHLEGFGEDNRCYAHDYITGLLETEKEDRIGFNEMKLKPSSHCAFKRFPWHGLHSRTLRAPIVVDLNDDGDTRYFPGTHFENFKLEIPHLVTEYPSDLLEVDPLYPGFIVPEIEEEPSGCRRFIRALSRRIRPQKK